MPLTDNDVCRGRQSRVAFIACTIDYEIEYDNRGRVPEHPEIFARWQRDAAAYRAAARDAELGLAYGPGPRQTIDLFPAKDDDESTPLALFIHGGWWRSLEPAMFSQLAAGPNARGVSVAVAGYDLCPQVLDRHHHRTDAQRLSVAVAQAQKSAFSCTAIPPAAISPPVCWRRIGRPSRPTRRPIWCRRPMRSPACSTSRRWCMCRRMRICGSTKRKRGGCRRSIGRCPPAARSMPWSARWSRANSCARARSSPTAGARAAWRRVTRKSPAPIISPWSMPLSDPDSAMTRRVAQLARDGALAL